MAQDNQPEKEAKEEILEEMPDFEVQTKNPAEQNLVSPDKKPDIPDLKKPDLPQKENIPAGGPGDQNQNQSTTHSQTQEEKAKKIKDQLKKPIQIDTAQERKDSCAIEDEHNKDVLNQP